MLSSQKCNVTNHGFTLMFLSSLDWNQDILYTKTLLQIIGLSVKIFEPCSSYDRWKMAQTSVMSWIHVVEW